MFIIQRTQLYFLGRAITFVPNSDQLFTKQQIHFSHCLSFFFIFNGHRPMHCWSNISSLESVNPFCICRRLLATHSRLFSFQAKALSNPTTSLLSSLISLKRKTLRDLKHFFLSFFACFAFNILFFLSCLYYSNQFNSFMFYSLISIDDVNLFDLHSKWLQSSYDPPQRHHHHLAFIFRLTANQSSLFRVDQSNSKKRSVSLLLSAPSNLQPPLP